MKTTFNTLAVAITLNLAGTNLASAAVDIPSSLPGSSTFGALPFSQQMLRFEEFGVRPLPAPGSTTAKNFPLPVGAFPADVLRRPECHRHGCLPGCADLAGSDALRPMTSMRIRGTQLIAPCQGFDPVTFTGVMEGRPPGVSFSHQRWDEFKPVVYFETAMGGARAGTGIRDDEQSHSLLGR